MSFQDRSLNLKILISTLQRMQVESKSALCVATAHMARLMLDTMWSPNISQIISPTVVNTVTMLWAQTKL